MTDELFLLGDPSEVARLTGLMRAWDEGRRAGVRSLTEADHRNPYRDELERHLLGRRP